ncbi:SDR family oxidoreductase [Candidatus Latescibacterota bacterium]
MKYLVTGGAGFIGSNLAETLLNSGEEVVVLDDLSTGKRSNIETFIDNPRFTFIEGSITDPVMCAAACAGVDAILHQAAFISSPGSIEDPYGTHETNVTGSINIFEAARRAGIKNIVWASSSAVYGNTDILPNVETMPLCPLSPYAASKAAVEMFARSYCESYGMTIIGLRYFNVFGQRQDPASAYAAVIPLFISGLMSGEPVTIFGDGKQTRDFVHIENVVQANINAATQPSPGAGGRSYNIGCGESITINELYDVIASKFGSDVRPVYAPARQGDVRDSFADISGARNAFGYDPEIHIEEGLKKTIEWNVKNA